MTASGFLFQTLALLRPMFFWAACVLAVVAVLDWLVRTRRISPFSAIARGTRRMVDPLLKPMENRVLRAGGNPQHTPWWALGFVVVVGILVLELVGFLAGQAMLLSAAGSQGASGVGLLLLHWSFGILRLAIVVRVISSWFRISPWSVWVRWAYYLSEPLLRPVRQLIPALGMMDISPLIVWLLLGVIESFLVRMYVV